MKRYKIEIEVSGSSIELQEVIDLAEDAASDIYVMDEVITAKVISVSAESID